MTFLKFYLFFAFILVNLLDCQSYKACLKVKPASNWDGGEWFFRTVKKGQYILSTSECQNCEKGDIAWDWLRGRTTPTKVCFRIFGVTPQGYFNIDANCEMSNPTLARFNCEFDFSKYETSIKMKGTVTILLSDNENYAVANFCVFGKENIWYIISPYPTIDPELKEELLEEIMGLGFNNKEAVEGVSSVYLKNATLIDCKK